MCDMTQRAAQAHKTHRASCASDCWQAQGMTSTGALHLDKVGEERSVHEAARRGCGVRSPCTLDGRNYAGHRRGSFQVQGDAVVL